MKNVLSIFFLLAISFANTYSQKNEKLRLQISISAADNPENFSLKKNTFLVKDSTELFKKLNEIKEQLIQSGYLAASIDSLYSDSLNYSAFLHVGGLYKWKELSFKNTDNEAIRNSGFDKKDFTNKKVNFEKFQITAKQLLNYYENLGYPFIDLGIDSLSIKNNYFTGKLSINKNQKIYIDTIFIKGKANISKKLIYKYIEIKPGDLFNQKKIDFLDKNLSKLAYIESAKPAELEFFEKKADIYIYLKKKKSNLFNGIVGFATDEEENNKLVFTGNIKLDLNNSLGIGENISLQWEGYKDSSQFLSIASTFPYLFFLPIGINANFQLDKDLLDYLNINYSFDLSYDLKPGNKIHTYFSQKNSFVIGNNPETVIKFENTTNYTFGFSLEIDKTNRLILPRKGYYFRVSSGYGNRWTEQNGNSAVTEAGFLAAYYWQITNELSLSFKNNSTAMFNKGGFYENELFKIGGIADMRGFDEKSILASAYSLFTFEPQFYISQYSFISVFTDYIYFETDNETGLKQTNQGFGIGAGISIDTNAGIFSLNFAVGKLNENPFQLSTTKIHFGYVVRF